MSCVLQINDNQSEVVQYDSAEYPIRVQHELLSDYPDYSVPSHWHDDIELIYILSGEMNYQVNGTVVHMRTGEGIFVNARQLHYGYSDDRQECRFLCVLLHPMLLCAVAETERQYILPVIRNTERPYVQLTPETAWTTRLMQLIEQIYRDKQTCPQPYLKYQISLFQIWDLLYENIAVDLSSVKSESMDLTAIKNMLLFLGQNYTHPLTLDEIATAGMVGKSKCCKLFALYLNRSPIQYLNQYRLNKSIELLRTTHLSITEIAFQVGFTGASYYTESFRKWLGQTPSAFRKS